MLPETTLGVDDHSKFPASKQDYRHKRKPL